MDNISPSEFDHVATEIELTQPEAVRTLLSKELEELMKEVEQLRKAVPDATSSGTTWGIIAGIFAPLILHAVIPGYNVDLFSGTEILTGSAIGITRDYVVNSKLDPIREQINSVIQSRQENFLRIIREAIPMNPLVNI